MDGAGAPGMSRVVKAHPNQPHVHYYVFLDGKVHGFIYPPGHFLSEHGGTYDPHSPMHRHQVNVGNIRCDPAEHRNVIWH